MKVLPEDSEILPRLEPALTGKGWADLPKQIVRYRAQEDISQAELASRVGVDRGTINKAENGKRVSRLTVAKIERILEGNENGKA